jgi:DNA-binding protein H-NS
MGLARRRGMFWNLSGSHWARVLTEEMMAAKKRSNKSRRRKSTRSAEKSSPKTKRRGRPRQSTSLATMALDALISLRDDAEQLIRARASAQREALEKQLTRLGGYLGDGEARKARKGRSLKGRKVAPKYRNPANKSETWAGRGVRPRWLQAALKQGGSLDEFAIVRGRAPGKKGAGRKKVSTRKKRPVQNAAAA